MSTRSALVLAVVGPVLVHCGGQTLTIGSNDGGATTTEGGGAAADAGGSLPFGDDSSTLSEGGGPPSTIEITTCVGDPADAWSPRAGVCSCASTEATKISESDPLGLSAAMLGRWVWCGNEAPPSLPQGFALPHGSGLFDGPGMGIEFASGSTWYELKLDSTGALTRSGAASEHGTFSFTGGPTSLVGIFGQEPGLTLELEPTTGDPSFTKVVVTQNPRALLLNTELQSDGQIGSFIENAILFPDTSPATVTVSACAEGPPDASATTGVGLTAVPPAECTAASGPAHAVASPADVSSLLVGDWLTCGGQVFGLPIPSADGIELAMDGSYRVLGETADGSLVPLDSIAGSDAGSGPSVPGTGTYDVVDGSATYGAGAYELRLHPLGGGIFIGQVAVSDAPRQLRYFAPNGSPQVYAHPAPWSPRAGVCSCASAGATQVAQNDAAALAASMVGRWVWCGNEPLPSPSPPLPPNVPVGTLFDGPGMGIEFTSDGSWYELDEDSTGMLSRGAGPSDHGTFQVLGINPTNPAFVPFYSPEPLTLQLQTTTYRLATKVVVTQGPRALLLNTIRQPDGKDGAVMQNAVLFPLP